MPFPPTFDRAWDETFPPDTQLANLLGQDIRNFKTDIRERLSLISGTLANRPTNLDAVFGGASFGMIYFSTDTSQIFQWNGSAWNQINGNIITQPGQLNVAPNVTGQDDRSISASLGSTNIFTVPASGIYMVSAYMIQTASNSLGSVGGNYVVNYTDNAVGASSTSISFTFIGGIGAKLLFPNGGTTVNATEPSPLTFYLQSGSTFNLAVTLTFNGGATGTFRLIHKFVYLG
jgi:hypothetical protein